MFSKLTVEIRHCQNVRSAVPFNRNMLAKTHVIWLVSAPCPSIDVVDGYHQRQCIIEGIFVFPVCIFKSQTPHLPPNYSILLPQTFP